MVSDSAKLRITSRNEGTEPVVIAFTRGIVMVGDVAWAVKGMAAPDLIRLEHSINSWRDMVRGNALPLSELEARVVGIYKIAGIVSAMPVSLSWKF